MRFLRTFAAENIDFQTMKLKYLLIFGLIVSTSSFMQEGTENFVQSWTKQGGNCIAHKSCTEFISTQTITINSDEKEREVSDNTIVKGIPAMRMWS